MPFRGFGHLSLVAPNKALGQQAVHRSPRWGASHREGGGWGHYEVGAGDSRWAWQAGCCSLGALHGAGRWR